MQLFPRPVQGVLDASCAASAGLNVDCFAVIVSISSRLERVRFCFAAGRSVLQHVEGIMGTCLR